ncbi:MAG: hypothetical protein PHC58_06450 [Candidatus Omnitrophica bacterium]|nr:hypothetical protein [Candidatus Omnitrophota bacterium]
MLVYDNLPYFFKKIAVNIEGYRLKKNRGNKFNEYFSAAVEKERWTRHEWDVWQSEHIRQLLVYASENVPYYIDYWKDKDPKDILFLDKWPVIKKETIRQFPKEFISLKIKRWQLIKKETSGTTGKPLKIFTDKKSLSSWYAIFRQRILSDYAITHSSKWAIMGGKRIIPIKQQKPPYWVENKCDNQLYLSVYHITKYTAKDYLKKMESYDPAYMIVYPSACSLLAEYVLQNKLDVPKNLKVIFSNAEFLSKWQKEIISCAFKTKVIDTYGSVEMVCAGTECAEGKLHLWPDCAKVEVLKDDKDVPVEYGAEGRMVATGLGNYCMPLIRYDTGDRGVVVNSQCLCGRDMSILEKISGRSDDMLILKDGRKIFWINPCFYGLPIKNSQVIQEHCGKIRALIEPDSSFSCEHENKLKNNFIAVLGEEDICIEKVNYSDFERTENNKIKSVIRKYG